MGRVFIPAIAWTWSQTEIHARSDSRLNFVLDTVFLKRSNWYLQGAPSVHLPSTPVTSNAHCRNGLHLAMARTTRQTAVRENRTPPKAARKPMASKNKRPNAKTKAPGAKKPELGAG